MYEALITDIDGTVTAVDSDGSDISEQTRKAVQAALLQGKRIACATGRGWPSAKPVIQRLGLSDPCIIEGGSCIIDPQTEKILWEMTLDEAASNKVLSVFKKLATDKATVKSTSNNSRLPLDQITDMTGSNRIIYLLGVDAATAEMVVHAINMTNFAVAHKTTPSWYGADFTDVHVTHPLGTKEQAISKWQEMMNVAKEKTIGLGDSENDLPLFKSVGLTVLVANAHDNLKSLGDKVVPEYNSGGLEFTINNLLLEL